MLMWMYKHWPTLVLIWFLFNIGWFFLFVKTESQEATNDD